MQNAVTTLEVEIEIIKNLNTAFVLPNEVRRGS
jgi:hypothetical protein